MSHELLIRFCLIYLTDTPLNICHRRTITTTPMQTNRTPLSSHIACQIFHRISNTKFPTMDTKPVPPAMVVISPRTVATWWTTKWWCPNVKYRRQTIRTISSTMICKARCHRIWCRRVCNSNICVCHTRRKVPWSVVLVEILWTACQSWRLCTEICIPCRPYIVQCWVVRR